MLLTAGTFKGENDAARAYDSACTKMYGPAAIINFPVPLTRARKEGRTAGSKEAELELAAMEGDVPDSALQACLFVDSMARSGRCLTASCSVPMRCHNSNSSNC